MSDGDFGVPRTEGRQLALRFERRYDATPDEVWAAVTDPESIKRWLFADAVLEPRVGGAFRLAWRGGEHAEGSVLAWDPPHLLETEWIEPDTRSILRIEISAVEGGSLLVLDHRDVTLDPAIRVGAGWHSHLDLLGAVLDGRDAPYESWRQSFESLRPRYEVLVSATAYAKEEEPR